MEVIGARWFLIIVVYCVLFIDNGESQLSEGSACFHQKKKVNGVCKILSNCKSAEDALFDEGIWPQLCGFTGKDGKTQIVCCPYTSTEVTPAPTTKKPIPKTTNKSRYYCAEYAKAVFIVKYTVSTVPGAPPRNESQCGFKSTPLVSGGTEAKAREFPHMALVGYGEANNIQWNCGGTLISDFWVMTAAHCCYTQDYGEAKFVRLGDLNYLTTTDEAQPQQFTVAEIKKHPEHDFKQYNDIGLLKLDKKAEFTSFVRPACLWPEYRVNASSAIATGWGFKAFFGDKSAALLKVTLELKTHELCNKTFEVDYRLDQGILDNQQICAGAPLNDTSKVIKDTCGGDSGGPLQIYAEPEFYCMYYVIGITSFGKPCAIAKRPSVYVRVSNYLPWIESVVWP